MNGNAATMIKSCGIATLYAGLSLLSGAAAAADVSCIESWSEAASVIRQEKLIVIEQLSRSFRAELGGDIVRTTLCSKDGRYVYRLVVRSPSGPLKDVSVDARRPFDR
jgi:hypothetical protein